MRTKPPHTTLRWLAACALLAATHTAVAQDKPANYPNRAIRLVNPYSPGGTTDLVARMISARLTETWKQQIIVDNRPGAGTNIGNEIVARAAPDGYTLLFSTQGHTVLPLALLGAKLQFDPFKDLAPIAPLVYSTQMIVAHPSLNVRSIPELVKLAKARPGELAYGSAGVGTSNHLGIELLKHMAGIELAHVPYKGGSQMAVDLTGGRVHLTLNSMITIMPYVKSGRLWPLAVGAAKRSPAMPDVPTVAESGYPDYQVSTWYGLYTTAGTPRNLINTLNGLVNKALTEPQVAKSFSSQGAEPLGGRPEDLTKIMRDDYERWRKLIAAAKLQIE